MKFVTPLIALFAVVAIAGSAYSVIARDYPPRLSVSVDGVPGYVYYNRPYDVTIHYANHGGPTDQPVELTAVLPAGFALQGRQGGITVREQTMVWQLGKLSAGDSGEVQITIKGVLPTDLTDAVYTLPGYEGHTAFEEGFEMPVTLSSGRHAASALQVADTGDVLPLTLSKTGPAVATAGSNVTYTITLENIGGAASPNVSVADTIPAGMTFVSATAPAGWSLTTPAVGGTGTVTATNPSVAAGSSHSFTYVFNLGAGVAEGTVITNTVTATVQAISCCLASIDTTVQTADLSVTKAGTPDSASAGENIAYTLTVTNPGPGDAQNVELTDVLPAGTTFVSMTAPAGWSITTPAVGGTGTVTSTIATLAPGSAAFTLVVNVDAGTPDGTVISNTATVAATSGDNDQTNNSATENTPVGDLATIVVQLEVDPAPDAQDFVFTDTIPGCNIGTLDDDNNGSRPNSATCAAPTGSYSVSQAVVSGYGLDVDCSDPDGGTSVTGNSASIDLDAAETVTCVFENQRQGDDGTPLLPTAAPTSTPTQQPSPRPAPTQTPAPGASVAGIQPPSTGDGGVSRQAGLSSLLILGVTITLAVVGLRVAGSRRRL